MDQQNKDSSDRLWASLNAAIEAQPSRELNLKDTEVEREFHLPDRLAGSYLSGFWPLLVLYLLTVSLTTNLSVNPLLGVGGVIAGLVAAYLCRPLLKTEFGMSPFFLALASPFFFLLVTAIQLIPSAIIYETTAQTLAPLSKPLDIFLAEQLQHQLEALLDWSHLIGLALGLLMICSSLVLVKKRFPWIEHTKPGLRSRFLSMLFFLLPWFFLAYFVHTPYAVEKWSDQLAPIARRFPAGSLEQEQPIHFWKKLASRLEKATGPELPSFSSTFEPPKDALARLRTLESEMLEAFQNRKPTSLEELSSSMYALEDLASRAPFIRHPLDVAVALEGETFYGVHTHNDYVWKYGVIPWLGAPERNADELQESANRLAQLNETTLPNLLSIDLAVYSVLTGARSLPAPARFVIRSEKSGKGNFFLSEFPPQDMQVFGRRVQLSPTRLLDRWFQKEFVEHWLAIRSEFAGELSYSQKVALSKKTEQAGSLRDYYRGWAATQALAREQRAMRQTTAVYARVLAYRARHGKLPATLAEAGVQDNKRWKVQNIDGNPCLLDRELPTGYMPRGLWRLR